MFSYFIDFKAWNDSIFQIVGAVFGALIVFPPAIVCMSVTVAAIFAEGLSRIKSVAAYIERAVDLKVFCSGAILRSAVGLLGALILLALA